MPADHSKQTPSTRTRRTARKEPEDDKLDSNHAREIELKRSRGEISCAECRRLKIRCDKTIPCQSCQRRGCAALCPNGSLATGQGTRFVLAATEHLHKRIAKMGERIRQLEDALAILQAKCSNEPHPLLRDDALAANTPEQEEDGPAKEPSPMNGSTEVIEAFGTLSVYDHGMSRFFGPSGGTEYLLYVDNESRHTSPSIGSKSPESLRDSLSPPLPGESAYFSAAFPLTPMGPPGAVLELIESHLPSWERACHLCEVYIEHAGWLFRGVTRQQLLVEMLPSIYKRPTVGGASPPKDEYNGPHDLALLYVIYGIGALMDLNQEPYNAEGEHYHQLARAALSLQPVLEKPSLVTIQALHLLSVYNGLAGNENMGSSETSLETTWSLLALAAQLSQAIGLHRDSSRWGLSDSLVNRRRLLFWNLFVADSWTSLTTGRPPSFAREYIDCKFPASDEQPTEDVDPENDFGTWGFRFALQCVSEVAARTLTAEAPSYATIMELDRKVREFPIPADASALIEDLKTPTDGDEPLPLSVSMTRFVLSHSREVILLSIHRAFFAQAIIDCPENPLRSQYAPSFLAAYRASCTILKVINTQFALLPTLCARFWSIWTYAFSSAVVFGTVVTKGPRSPLAPAAVAQLDVACELFTKAAQLSRRAAKALPILNKLKEKAHFALRAPHSDISGDGAMWKYKDEDEVDELEVFAGKTRLVESKRPSPSPMLSATSDGSQSQSQLQSQDQFDYQPPPVISPPAAPQIPPLPGSSSASPMDGNYYTNPGYPYHTGPSQQQTTNYPPTTTYDRQTTAYAWSQPPPPQHVSHQQHRSLNTMSQSIPLPSPSNPHSGLSMPAQHQHPHAYNATSTQSIPPQYPQQQMQSESYIRDGSRRSSQVLSSNGGGSSEGAQGYPGAPSFQGVEPTYVPPTELVNLGLASRESRLDERWASFMHDNGYLDGLNFRS
ncbi:hypothetical protein ABKN59_002009 [Abortiporus biennis]